MTSAYRAYIRQTINQAVKSILATIKKIFILGYLLYWDYKQGVWHYIKILSLGIISIPTALLVVELVTEVAFHTNLKEYFVKYVTTGRTGTIVFVAFILATFFLILHHYKETKKSEYEYKFVRQTCQFIIDRGISNGNNLVATTLPLFHKVFEHTGILHCSFYSFNNTDLTIQPDNVYPTNNTPQYLVSLPLNGNTGVATKVFKETKPYYSPRLSFFKKKFPFPHAIKLDFATTNQGLEIQGIEPSMYVFEPLECNSVGFSSFVSVPVKSVTNKQFGVLNFDFKGVDPLDRSHIAMATVFGLLLGDELDRAGNTVFQQI